MGTILICPHCGARCDTGVGGDRFKCFSCGEVFRKSGAVQFDELIEGVKQMDRNARTSARRYVHPFFLGLLIPFWGIIRSLLELRRGYKGVAMFVAGLTAIGWVGLGIVAIAYLINENFEETILGIVGMIIYAVAWFAYFFYHMHIMKRRGEW